VIGGRTSPTFPARYLLDALQSFAGSEVRMAIQSGLRATIISAVDPAEVELEYFVMPRRRASSRRADGVAAAQVPVVPALLPVVSMVPR
jgi:hypothetical protein